MGHVFIEITVSDPEKKKSAAVEAMVDTGAMLTVLPQRLADELGIKAVEEQTVATGGGPVKVKHGRALIMVNGKEELFRVWISDIIDKVLLGVVVLEVFGFKVDPVTGKLEEKPMLMY
ncbi:retroviral-like aspartic protease family protein [Candidatus Woesearchaeota archaeon]|nr:retroviral-like aspartic protease family protein [Candidatus Woesearchaeota archaeon]